MCYRSSRVETQAFNEVYVNLVMFILSRTDLGVLIKQQMRRRKELVKFSTTVIFYLPPTIPNKKESVSVASFSSQQELLKCCLSFSAADASPSSVLSHCLPSRRTTQPVFVFPSSKLIFPSSNLGSLFTARIFVGLELKQPFPLGGGEGLPWVWSQGC